VAKELSKETVKPQLAVAESPAVVKRPWFGAKLQAMTPEIAGSLGLKRPVGVVVASVTPRSPAARAGLRARDVVLSVDGQEVGDVNAFEYRFVTTPLSRGQATLTISRDGQELKVAVALESVSEAPRDEAVIKTRSPFLGARIANLTPSLAEELRIDMDTRGVVVIDVESGSTADNFGLRKGDIVLTVNNIKIETTRDLVHVLSQPSRTWRITIQRAERQISVVYNDESVPEAPRDEAVIKTRSPFLGARISNLTPSLAEELRIDKDTRGVVVIDVESGSTADNFGLRKGDIVLTVNNIKIETTRDLVRVLSQPSRVWRLTIQRGERQISVVYNG
jgi:S1-C subfamily serine protease